MSSKRSITVAHGNGIGPEIMDATLMILKSAGASLDIETVEIGEKLYNKGILSGIEDTAWESLHKTKVFLKAPITTPQGGGFRSLNVTIRKTLGLYANVRPCVSYAPYIETKHPNMNVVVIRENEEDLYTGIEYRQTQQVIESLKLLSYRGSEKIIRYAFEYAKQNNRKKVTCFTKDNIMKMADGMFHEVFESVAKEYPKIESEHWIVDIGMAKVAHSPQAFDVIVVPNLYGDILSDITAQITGSVGLAGSANIGGEYAMFEAIHGSAPRRAGQNLANPSGLLLATVQMLVHLNMSDEAGLIQNAWLKTLEEGKHTYDVFREGQSTEKLGTKEFAQAIVDNLGKKPENLQSVSYKKYDMPAFSISPRKEKKELVGVDIFIDKVLDNPSDLAESLKKEEGDTLELKSLSNRGLLFWPGTKPLADASDHWVCRFTGKKDNQIIRAQDIISLLSRLNQSGLDCVKTENLYNFDGKPSFFKISNLN